jgi:hypothetical protein
VEVFMPKRYLMEASGKDVGRVGAQSLCGGKR